MGFASRERPISDSQPKTQSPVKCSEQRKSSAKFTKNPKKGSPKSHKLCQVEKDRDKMPVERRGVRALQIWCQRVTSDYPSVTITDMSTSWRDGLAFCAIIHHFRPNLIDFASLKAENVLENNALAYRVAEEELGIPSLLDPEDMMDSDVPDKFSIITYVSQFYHLLKDEDNSRSPSLQKKEMVSVAGVSPQGTPESVPRS